MGKETKIGLGVIAVLMTVFGVLLFRHLQASHELPSRGLGDQTAVKPLPTHGDVTVASDESRITGSKLWDTPAASAASAAIEVAAGESVDPYEAQPAKPQAEVVVAGGPRKSGNPLRQASAEVPVEASEELAEYGGDEADPLMTVPDATEPASDDPYAAQATEFAPSEAPSPANNAFESPAPRSAALRNPFDQAPPIEAAPAPGAHSDQDAPEPAWTETETPAADTQNDPPTNAFAPRPATSPIYEDEPQQPAQFDRFESSAAETSIPGAATEATAPDAWRNSASAAAPLPCHRSPSVRRVNMPAVSAESVVSLSNFLGLRRGRTMFLN